MDIETMEKIITMVGEATGDAAIIAILWIVGGFLVALINSGLVVYVAIQLIKLAYKYVGDKEQNKKWLEDALAEIKEKNRAISTHEEDLTKRDVLHRIELEKIKHLYSILKEKSDVEPISEPK